MDRFKLVKEFSKELTSTLELKELANVINNFAVINLGAAHSSIVLEKGKYLYNNEEMNVFKGIEEQTFKYVMRVRKMLIIPNPRSEYMFKDVKDIDLFDKSIISLPLITKNQVLGSLNLYFNNLPGDEAVDFLSLFAELSASSIMNSLAYKSLEAKSMTDKLTGLYNRRSFDIEIEKQIGKCSEAHIPISVMMLDIDNFKEYNDLHGHQKGDMILEDIGKTISRIVGESCAAFRYGGEEIAAIIPKLSSGDAFKTAENIRKGIESSGRITVSIGLVTCMNSSCPASTMISEADKALYSAKKSGKNKIATSIIIDKSISPIDVQKAAELGKKR